MFRSSPVRLSHLPTTRPKLTRTDCTEPRMRRQPGHQHGQGRRNAAPSRPPLHPRQAVSPATVLVPPTAILVLAQVISAAHTSITPHSARDQRGDE